MNNFVILALGSNVGDKLENIKNTIKNIETGQNTVQDCSNIYSSQALLPEDAPENWDMDFYNCVLSIKTPLTVENLLQLNQKIENEINGTIGKEAFWAPRKIDIDIIAFNDLVLDSEKLKIPHPRMFERDFVILPLADIAPNWQNPLKGVFYNKSAQELSESFKGKSDIIKTNINPLK